MLIHSTLHASIYGTQLDTYKHAKKKKGEKKNKQKLK